MRSNLVLTFCCLLLNFSILSQNSSEVLSEKVEGSLVVSQDWLSISEMEYQISYPSDWTLDNSGLMGSTFFLFSPLMAEDDLFKENVNLMIQDLRGYDVNLEQFVELTLEQVKKMITDGLVLSNDLMEKDGREYQKLMYSGKQGQFDLIFEQYCWVVNDQAYVLTFSGEQDHFEFYKETAAQMLNSFSLK